MICQLQSEWAGLAPACLLVTRSVDVDAVPLRHLRVEDVRRLAVGETVVLRQLVDGAGDQVADSPVVLPLRPDGDALHTEGDLLGDLGHDSLLSLGSGWAGLEPASLPVTLIKC